ncbi:hypothetical protein [Halobacteriovorax sp. JY17]|uniref:hypothetical protein n=1 Tax=Halobacteriovorax sp. JY17 TaxID=2014617 RepID=UPI000C37DE2D|nr:hypothetical protein [Halobacteriovorax sp. JY17]PIK15705.1 MAG: hypothetical protein CES88_02965 [Halobacteriovorax sp. JY17]
MHTHKILLALLLSFSTLGAVWHADNAWDNNYEEMYSKWMTSKEVHAKLFVDPASKYYGLRADCADAAYALRAIFSFENSLPFAISNPSGGRSNNYLSNSVTAFDRISNPHKRVVAFLNNLGESVGTENLSRLDTYPVKLASIRPSTLFTYKIKGRFGKVIRHAYTIKNIQTTGSFDLIYSTQAIKKENLPMNYREGKELVNLPQTVWGFRRFKSPEYLGTQNSALPEFLSYSEEQFSLAKKLGQNEFFTYVKSLLKTENETPNKLIARVLKNICQEASQRIGNVNQGVAYNNSRNGRCMDYTDYDIYSTPARDKALKGAYESLAYNWQKIGSQVSDNQLALIVESIVKSTYLDEELVLEYCPIRVEGLATYNLAELWRRIRNGNLSSHPNDSLGARWGEAGVRTSCKVWY